MSVSEDELRRLRGKKVTLKAEATGVLGDIVRRAGHDCVQVRMPGPTGTPEDNIVVINHLLCSVSEVLPENWPPQRDDLWESPSGTMYLCGESRAADWRLVPSDLVSSTLHPAGTRAASRVLSDPSDWKLRYRRVWHHGDGGYGVSFQG